MFPILEYKIPSLPSNNRIPTKNLPRPSINNLHPPHKLILPLKHTFLHIIRHPSPSKHAARKPINPFPRRPDCNPVYKLCEEACALWTAVLAPVAFFAEYAEVVVFGAAAVLQIAGAGFFWAFWGCGGQGWGLGGLGLLLGLSWLGLSSLVLLLLAFLLLLLLLPLLSLLLPLPILSLSNNPLQKLAKTNNKQAHHPIHFPIKPSLKHKILQPSKQLANENIIYPG